MHDGSPPAIASSRAAADPDTTERTGAPELTVVIPTFCERDNVALIIERIDRALAGIRWEAIFVDDDSPDGTAAMVKTIGANDARIRCIRRIKRRGLAGACIEGMLASQAAYVAVMDADLQHDEYLLVKMLARLRANDADIAVGTRYEAGGAVALSRARLSISRLATYLAMRLLDISVTDPMSGFFMIRRPLAEEIAPRLSTQGFKILMDVLASADSGVRVLELPYTFRSRQHGESKLDSKVALDFANLLLAKMTGDLIPPQFFAFLVVGAVGILVHLAVLNVILSFTGLEFIWAQAGATLVAATSNFFLNNVLTYRDQRLTGKRALLGLAIFIAICLVGAVSNIGIAVWLYNYDRNWWIAGLFGSIVSAVWNYAVSSTLVWRALSPGSR